MARLGEIEYRGDGSDPKQLLNYMLQLEEQIKYALAHLGSENIQAGAIDEKLLAPAVKQNIQNIQIRVEGQERKSRELKSEDGKLRTLILETEEGIMRDMADVEAGLRTTITETAAGINTSINDKLGNYYTKSETATEINTRMGNALGDYYTKTETAQKIQTDMGDALGNYYTKTETAGEISAYVSNHTYGLVSGVDIKPAGVEISGGKYVRIKSGGQLIIDTGNLRLYQDGTAQFTGRIISEAGSIGGFEIQEKYIGSWDDYFYLRKGYYSTAGDQYIAGGLVMAKNVPTQNNNHPYVLAAFQNGQVFVGVESRNDHYELSLGWIRDITKDNGVLTIIKYDGTTITYP